MSSLRPAARPRAWRRRPLPLAAAAMVLTLVASPMLAACSSGSDQAAEVTAFRERAGVTTATAWAARYRLDTTGQKTAASVDVARVPDQLRLDITTGKGVATNISGAKGTVSCQQTKGKAAICVQAAGPGQVPPAALDPALRSVIATTLPAIAAGRGDVQVLGSSGDPKLTGATCARVSGDEVADGVYCLFLDGIPASANFPSGSLTFVERLAPPTAATFKAPASPRPR